MTTWQTADGRKYVFEELSQQHLSNIFWYHTLVAGNLSIRLKVLTELQRRFPDSENGRDKVLHYEPQMSDEIDILEEKGYLINDDNGFRRIVRDGKFIGVCPTEATISLLRALQIIQQEVYGT